MPVLRQNSFHSVPQSGPPQSTTEVAQPEERRTSGYLSQWLASEGEGDLVFQMAGFATLFVVAGAAAFALGKAPVVGVCSLVVGLGSAAAAFLYRHLRATVVVWVWAVTVLPALFLIDQLTEGSCEVWALILAHLIVTHRVGPGHTVDGAVGLTMLYALVSSAQSMEKVEYAGDPSFPGRAERRTNDEVTADLVFALVRVSVRWCAVMFIIVQCCVRRGSHRGGVDGTSVVAPRRSLSWGSSTPVTLSGEDVEVMCGATPTVDHRGAEAGVFGWKQRNPLMPSPGGRPGQVTTPSVDCPQHEELPDDLHEPFQLYSTIVRVDIEVAGGSSASDYGPCLAVSAHLAAEVAATAARFGASVLELTMTYAVVAFHLNPLNASCQAMTDTSDTVLRLVTDIERLLVGREYVTWFSVCAASGSLSVLQMEIEDADRVQAEGGAPLEQVHLLSSLSRVLRCTCLLTQTVYESLSTGAVQTSPLLEVVDCVAWPSSDKAAERKACLVYALCPRTADALIIHNAYQGAFAQLCAGRVGGAMRAAEECLREAPHDLQAQRLLNLAQQCLRTTAPYARTHVGWQAPGPAAADAGGAGGGTSGSFSTSSCGSSGGVPLAPPRGSQGSNALEHRSDSLVGRAESLAAMIAGGGTDGETPANEWLVDLLLRTLEETSRDQTSTSELSSSAPQPLAGGGSSGGLPTDFYDANGQRQWRTRQKLGCGSFGTVWLGLSGKGLLTALKFIPLAGGLAMPEPATSSVVPLVKEVVKLTPLSHPNIVGVRGYSVTVSHVVLCLECVCGGSLLTLVNELGALGYEAVVRYAEQILGGLAYLHKNGIAHKRLSPAKVLIGGEGICKLSDFVNYKEHAKAGHGPQDPYSASPLLTPYMSPESFNQRASFDPLGVDVWAFGVLVYQMRQGRLPYTESILAMPQSFGRGVAIGTIRPVNDVQEVALRELLRECWQRRPNLRWCSFRLQDHRLFSRAAAHDERQLAAAAADKHREGILARRKLLKMRDSNATKDDPRNAQAGPPRAGAPTTYPE